MWANVNLVAVIVSAIASMGLGMLWYGPLFGKTWMREMKIKMPSKDKMPNMTKEYILAFLGSAVTAYVLSYFMGALGAAGWMSGVKVALWAWLGFLATSALAGSLWEGKSWKMYAINVLYHAVNLAIMGAILGAWM